MENIAFYDAKPYDMASFESYNDKYMFRYFEDKLNPYTAKFAEGMTAVCAFVNDNIGKETIDALYNAGVRCVVLRSAGFNNVDTNYAKGKLAVMRVPAYSPYAVAEHAMALLLTLNRKTHKAYLRTRDFNFNINNLTGFDLHGKAMGIIGTGKIGQVFIDICKGFGMEIYAYDMYPNENLAKEKGYSYHTLEEVFNKSDIISLHCPLTKETKYIINEQTINLMKKDAVIINTSRGKLIDSEALLKALREKRIGGACLDVYEEESDIFYEDLSADIVNDDILSLLVSLPNVIITSHQAYLTKEALESIAKTTVYNLDNFFEADKNVNYNYENSCL